MVVNTDDFDVLSQPQYLDDAQAILQVLKQLTYEQAKAMWHCSDKLARENFAWLQEMSLTQHQTPAILATPVFNTSTWRPTCLPRQH